MKKKKKRLFSRLERFIYKVCIVIIIALIIGLVCSETTLARVNVDVQNKEKEVEIEKKKIASLEMKMEH